MGRNGRRAARTLRFALPALLVLIATARPVAAQTDVLGALRVVEGTVTILRGEAAIPVTDRAQVREGDRLRTNGIGRVYVRLVDGATTVEAMVAPDTRVAVAALRDGRERSPFALLFGALRLRVRELLNTAPVLRTPSTVVGVKGTDFIAYVKRRKATEFIGIAGLIEAVSRSRPEYSLRIGQRQWGEVVANRKPAPPIRVPDNLWLRALADFAFPADVR